MSSARAVPFWDQHACLPLVVGTDVDPLARYQRRGGALVTLNAGYAPQSAADVRALLGSYRERVESDARFTFCRTTKDIDAVMADDRIGVVFDLEDAGPLEADVGNVAAFHALGVRALAPTYNHRNAAGGGCLDVDDSGLTPFGRDLLRELNAVGVTADGSHGSARTGLDLCAYSDKPVVYSHSNLRTVWEHPRNITDDQARACAGTGGVIGITGVGIFLGPNTPTVDAMIAHLEFAIDLVGIDHVGLGSDYPFDADDFARELSDHPHLFPDDYTRWGPIGFVPPERLSTVPHALAKRGFDDAAIEAIMFGNFARVAAANEAG